MGKKLFIGLTLIIILSLGSVGGTLFWFATNPPALQALIQQQTGLMVETDSLQFTLRPLPFLRLKAQNVVISSKSTDPPLATIGQLSFILNLRELLLGRILIEAVVLKQSQGMVNFSEEGNFQLGQWVLPGRSQEAGILGLFTLRVNRLLLSQSGLQVTPPSSWQMPKIQFSQIFLFWERQEGSLQAQTEIEWGGKQGNFSGQFQQTHGRWRGHYQLSHFPLHPFTIPQVPKVFPAMSVEGELHLEGEIREENDDSFTSQLSWKVNHGKLLNPQFPKGQLPLLAASGQLDFAMNAEHGATIQIELGAMRIPPGNLQGSVGFHFPPEETPSMRVAVAAKDWEVNVSKPYIFGFMPPIANDWVRAHVHDGQIKQFHFDLRWEMTPEFNDVNDVLHLNLRSELSGVSVDPFENIPSVSDIHGYLHLGLWGLAIEVDQGKFPGSTLESGIFSIGYGAPVITPFKLEIYGQAEATQTWPIVLELWEESVPWLQQLSFQGKAAVKFLLEDDNMLDDRPLTLEFQIFPDVIEAQWQTPQKTYRVGDVKGLFLVNLNELVWQNLQFTHPVLKGQSDGKFSFTSQDPLVATFHLDSLEKFLPIYQIDNHLMQRWIPQQLSADLELKQSFREDASVLWQLQATTTDEWGQNLNVHLEWEHSDWRIPQISGKLGQLELSGFLDFPSQEGALRVQIESLFSDALDFEVTWFQEMAEIALKTPQFRWQDWLHWRLSEDLLSLLSDSQPPFFSPATVPSQTSHIFSEISNILPMQQWRVKFQTSALHLSPNVKPAVVLAGSFLPGPPYELSLEQFEIENTKGRLFYRGDFQAGDLLLSLDQLQLMAWHRLVRQYLQDTDFDLDSSPEPSPELEQDSEGLQALQVYMEIKDFHLPGNAPVPLQTRFRFEKDLEKFDFLVENFVLGNQQGQARFQWEDAQIELDIQGSRLEMQPWFNAIQTQELQSLFTENSAGGLKTIHFTLKAENLYWSEHFSPKVVLQSTVQFDQEGVAPPKVSLQIKDFVLDEQQAQAQIQYQDQHLALQIKGKRLDPYDWLDFLQTQASAFATGKSHEASLIEHIQLTLEAEHLFFSETFSPKVSLHTTIDLPAPTQQAPFRWTVQVKNFELENQKLQADLQYQEQILALHLHGKGVQLEPWLDFVRNNTESSLNQGTAENLLKQIQFEAKFEDFYFLEEHLSAVSLQSVLHFPNSNSSPFFKWEVRSLESSASFLLPAVPDAFPSMPFVGKFLFSGEVLFNTAAEVSSHFNWKMTEGQLQNRVFPTQQMPLSMGGNLALHLLPQQESFLQIQVAEANLPFGTIQGKVDLRFFAEESPLLTVTAKTQNWELEKAKPYLYGLMPSDAKAWIETHTSGGFIDEADFNFRMALATDFTAVADIESLELNAWLSEVAVTPLENDLVIQNIAGHLNLGLWGGRLRIEQGDFPGIHLEQGELSLLYGTPQVTPLKIEVTGKVDGSVWPTVRSLLGEVNPILNEVSLSGNSDVKLLITDQDFFDETPFTLQLQLLPNHMEARLKTEDHTYEVGELHGTVLVTLETLIWQALHFKSGLFEGSTQGKISFDQNQSKFQLRLKNLERFLPIYEDPHHPFAQWFPKDLSATVELLQKENESTSLLWQAKAVTTDELGQQLELEIAWRDTEWEIQKLEGKLGQIEVQRALHLPNEERILEVKILPFAQEPIDIKLQWEGAAGSVSVKTSVFRWQDWLGWKLPNSLQTVFSEGEGSFPLEYLELAFETEALVLSPTHKIPLHVSGTMDFGEILQFHFPQVHIGNHTGQVSYAGTLQKGKLQLNWRHLDLDLVQEIRAYIEENTETYFTQQTQNLETQNWFEALAVDLNIGDLQFPGNPGIPLQTNFFFQREEQGFLLTFKDLAFNQQQAQGAINFRQDQLEIQIQSERLDVRSWLEFLQNWESAAPFLTAQTSSKIQKIRLDFKTEHLYFDEDLQPPLAFNLSLHLPPLESPEEFTTLTLHNFQSTAVAGEGAIVWKAPHPRVDLKITQLNPAQLLKDALKVSQMQWLAFEAQSDSSASQQFDFSLKIPEHQFNLMGNVALKDSDYQVGLTQFTWEQQEGTLQLERLDNQFKILGNFKYLDLEKWTQLQKIIAPSEDSAKSQKKTQTPFTIPLPANHWFVDVQAQKIKFLKSTFEQFVFQGQTSARDIKIPKLVWKNRDQQAFALAGNLKKLPSENFDTIWKGAFSAEISDLGEMIEMFFGKDSLVAQQYPISGGQSHLQADIQLLPAGTGHWKPEARLRFQSREGTVERGESLFFLLATFSLQSYLKATEGKLSGFEGKGLVYNTMKSEIQVKGGRFEIEEFLFASPNMRFVASGILDYEQDEQDLLICLQPFETLDLFLRKIPLLNLLLTSKRGSFLEGCYKSSGSIENPSIIPLPQTLLPGRLRDLLIHGFSNLPQDE